MSLKVCMMTPDSFFWNDDAEELLLPTISGRIGILPNHAPLITSLGVGVMAIRQNNKWTTAAVMGGFATIEDNTVTILVNEAFSGASIDRMEAKEALLQAEFQDDGAIGPQRKVAAQLELKRAKARYDAVTFEESA